MVMRSMRLRVQVGGQSELDLFQWDAPVCQELPMPTARRVPIFRRRGAMRPRAGFRADETNFK